MHLLIIIALGVFGGLWLFVKWGEWREAHAVRQYQREMRRINPTPAQSADDHFARGMRVTCYLVFGLIVVFAIATISH